MSFKRRDFLRAVGSGGAVVAFSCGDREAADRIARDSGNYPADLTWQKAPCRYCGTGCGVEVGVKDGKVTTVRGDEANPVNKGLLCVKGYHLPGMLYGEDRLLYPQRRDANGRLERISWDDALGLIAERYQATLDEHGPEAVAMYGSGQSGCAATISTPTRASAWPRP